MFQPTKKLQKLHCDTVGLFLKSFDGMKFLLLVVDNLTKFSFAFPVKLKSDISKTLTELITAIRTRFSVEVVALMTDNGTEFCNDVLITFCKEHGIARELSCPYQASENGLIERHNRSI